MLPVESIAPASRLEGTPQIVNATLPGAAPEQGLKIIRAAPQRFHGQCILRLGELLFKQPGQGSPIKGDCIERPQVRRFAKADKDFGQALLGFVDMSRAPATGP